MSDDEGRCRFNCRTQREAFIAGWMGCENIHATFHGYHPDKEAAEEFALRAYRKWRKEQRDTG